MPRIFAHRGLSAIAPENTLAALGGCSDYGVSWFETDVDIIADGTPIIIHDSSLHRTTNRTGSIYDLTVEQLDDIDAGSWFSPEFAGEPLPTLAQLIQVMNESKLNGNIEIKSNEQGAERTFQLIDAVIAELDKLDDERKVLISSFNLLLLAELKRRAPHYRTAALFTADALGHDWLSLMQLCGAETIHIEDRNLTQPMVALAQKAGFEVNVYTVNSRARANQLFNWGADGIITDYAHEMIHLENR
ncbi:glycerophosphoryl diester phosphodiesterase [Rothia sp. ZJ1223]|uniref:glycerophosphoryl diester phosphodiesterase n=1 Tax=Rothia sp. ZJ1223 TaxID=2811098 RepID=UPI0019587323|nr:glycerophosphoryl diester phosphodiesterase [Rothia sp. ZJ1223]MBM7052094.1 glycerophosphoryl diester phosphodiesterase [Rothia sp. ZJ1223]